MTDLRDFAGRYLVRDDGTQDPPWSLEIPGELGTVYCYGQNGTLAVLSCSDEGIRRLAHLGLKVVQRGDREAVFVFAPRQIEQVAAIIRALSRRR